MSFGGKAAGVLGILAIACSMPIPALAAEAKPTRWTSTDLPLEKLPSEVRDSVANVVDHPALYAHGPVEEVVCDPTNYYWLLDHPDRATYAWRRLGAKCVDIQDCGNDCFCCNDPDGNDVRWTTVYRSADMRIWYAEGSIRVGPLLKPVTGKAVLVVRLTEGTDIKGRKLIRQQTDMILHADSKTAAFVAKVLGASMPQLAEQYLVNQSKFFSLLAIYLRLHPDRAPALLAEKAPDEPQMSALPIPNSPSKARQVLNAAPKQP